MSYTHTYNIILKLFIFG